MVIEVTEFDSEAYLTSEAVMTSKPTKIAVRDNMQLDTRVMETADFKFVINFDLRAGIAT